MNKLSHRDRILSILAAERPDRFAASCWRHFYHMEPTEDGTVEAMLWFQKEFDWDFVKINPRADYHIEDWGLKQRYSKDEFTGHEKITYPVNSPSDWAKIKPLPATSPTLAQHLNIVSRIRKKLGPDIHIFMTMFSPLAIAGRMVAAPEILRDHLRDTPELVLPALDAISETFTRYASELRNAGADGLFFATTQWASADFITWEDYQRIAMPLDRKVLAATESDALNLLHVCSSNNYLLQLSRAGYPTKLLNWGTEDPTNLPLSKASQSITNMVLVGGIDHDGWLLKSHPEEIKHLIWKLKDQYDPTRLIIAPGCTFDPKVPIENLKAIREAL